MSNNICVCKTSLFSRSVAATQHVTLVFVVFFCSFCVVPAYHLDPHLGGARTSLEILSTLAHNSHKRKCTAHEDKSHFPFFPRLGIEKKKNKKKKISSTITIGETGSMRLNGIAPLPKRGLKSSLLIPMTRVSMVSATCVPSI